MFEKGSCACCTSTLTLRCSTLLHSVSDYLLLTLLSTVCNSKELKDQELLSISSKLRKKISPCGETIGWIHISNLTLSCSKYIAEMLRISHDRKKKQNKKQIGIVVCPLTPICFIILVNSSHLYFHSK